MASEKSERCLDEVAALTALEGASLSALSGLNLPVHVRLGSASITVGELLGVGPGAVLALDRRVDEPVEVIIGDRVVARGELVAIGDEMGVRITEIAAGAESGR